jgi:hypothetical protein
MIIMHSPALLVEALVEEAEDVPPDVYPGHLELFSFSGRSVRFLVNYFLHEGAYQ